MKIYTKTGDKGSTGLYHASERRSKSDPQIDAIGCVDELNANLGIVCNFLTNEYEGVREHIDLKPYHLITDIMRELFAAGTHLGTPTPVPEGKRIKQYMVDRIEREIDHFESKLDELTKFILPRGPRATPQIHVARAVCRRAERSVVKLRDELDVDDFDIVMVYLNRLSDLLFVLARYETMINQNADEHV